MAKKVNKQILELANEVIQRDAKRNMKFAAMDKMFYNRSEAPKDLANLEWFRWYPTTRPSDSAWGAARVLSSIQPRINIYPLGSSEQDKREANKRERIMSYQLMSAAQRAKANPTRQIVLSSILYDMTAVRVDFIPFLKKNPKMKVNSKRLSTAARFGQFALEVAKPATIHPIHDQYGLSSVVHAAVHPLRSAVGYWENSELEEAQGEYEWCYIVDYWDYDRRVTWAHLSDSPGLDIEEQNVGIVLVDAAHGLPFIPWNVKGGGSTMENDPEFHHRPLLDSVYHTEQYDHTNDLRSLMLSRVRAEFAKPLTKSTTMDGETPDFDYETPGGNVELEPGEDISDMAPPNMSPALQTAVALLESDMEASTVSRVLLGETPNDIAFATLNLGQQSAARSIIPYQEIAEETFTGMVYDMFEWAHFAKEDIQGKAIGNGDDEFTIKWDTIDPENILLEVKLEADIPSDRIQAINAAAMMYERLQVSLERAYQELGILDTTSVMDQRAQEDLELVEKQNAMNELNADFMAQVEQQAIGKFLASLPPELQQVFAQMQSGGAPQQQPGFVNPEDQLRGVEGIGGDGFNTGMGGLSSVEASQASNTVEGQRGVDREGRSIE